MQQSDFSGLGVAMITPFTKEGEVDYSALEKIVNHLVNGGVDYLVVHGTTGESVTLSSDEKDTTLDFVLDINAGRKPVVLGVGGNNTAAVAQRLKLIGTRVNGILSVSPYYNKPTQKGIIEHYKTLSTVSSLPIILYNVPGRTSSNMKADTTLALARGCKNIVGVKEASGDMEQIMTIIRHKPTGFQVISGDDALTLPILAAGGDGLISVVANAFPSLTKEMVVATMQGKMEEARAKHYRLLDIIPLLFEEGNPGGVKEVLAHMGICGNTVRQPLAAVSAELSQRLKAVASHLAN